MILPPYCGYIPSEKTYRRPTSTSKSSPIHIQARLSCRRHCRVKRVNCVNCASGAKPQWFRYSQPLIWQGGAEEALAASHDLANLSPAWKVMLLSDGSVTRHLELLTGMQVQVVRIQCFFVGMGCTAYNIHQSLLLFTTQALLDFRSRSLLAQMARCVDSVDNTDAIHKVITTNPVQLPTESCFLQDCMEMRATGCMTEGVPKEVSLVEAPYLQRQVLLREPKEGVALVYAVSWWNAEMVHKYLKDARKPIWASLSQERTELYRDIRTVYYGRCPDLNEEFQAEGPYWGRDYIFWNNRKPLTVIHEVFSSGLSKYL